LSRSIVGASLALLLLSVGSAAAARESGRHSQGEALSPPACGLVGGSLADPADTQRCLADRFKAAKPKPARSPAPVASSNAAPAASSNTAPPAGQGD